MTMNDPNQANYGLMPAGFGDGGLGGKHREYTNVYWTLAGLKAAIAAMIPAERRGGAYGTFNAVFGTFWFAGSALMGVLYDVSIRALVVFSVVAQLAALPILFALRGAGTAQPGPLPASRPQ